MVARKDQSNDLAASCTTKCPSRLKWASIASRSSEVSLSWSLVEGLAVSRFIENAWYATASKSPYKVKVSIRNGSGQIGRLPYDSLRVCVASFEEVHSRRHSLAMERSNGIVS